MHQSACRHHGRGRNTMGNRWAVIDCAVPRCITLHCIAWPLAPDAMPRFVFVLCGTLPRYRAMCVAVPCHVPAVPCSLRSWPACPTWKETRRLQRGPGNRRGLRDERTQRNHAPRAGSGNCAGDGEACDVRPWQSSQPNVGCLDAIRCDAVSPARYRRQALPTKPRPVQV
jgi:hypothetical protein